MWFFLMSKSKQNWHCLKGQSAFNARGKATILVGNKKMQSQNENLPTTKRQFWKKHGNKKNDPSACSTKENNKLTKIRVRKQQNYRATKQLWHTAWTKGKTNDLTGK